MSRFKTAAAVVDAGDPLRIGGLVVPFGLKDLDGETFDAETDLLLDLFPDEGRPVLFHHGLDPDVGPAVIGRQVAKTIDSDGVWIEAILDKRSRYVERVLALLAKGALGWSSGAIAHLVRVLKDGRIARWPWMEISLTPTPSSPAALVYSYPVKTALALEHLAEVGTAFPTALIGISQPIQSQLAAMHRRVNGMSAPARAVVDQALATLARHEREQQDELRAIASKVGLT